MSFVKTFEEILQIRKESADFHDAEMIAVVWETTPEAVQKLLPAPLKPVDRPLVTAFVANYPETNFSAPYLESALLVRASFNGEEGNYCLSMPVTNDMAMAGGREMWGYPKKMATIELHKDGDSVEGWTERHGIRFMKIKARLTGKMNDSAAVDLLAGMGIKPEGTYSTIAYNFKHFPSPEVGGTFDYAPRLTKGVVVFRPKAFVLAEADIELLPSEFDPWHELPVKRMLGGFYSVGTNSMLPGSVVAEANPIEFAPYAFLKWEWSKSNPATASREPSAGETEAGPPGVEAGTPEMTSETAAAVRKIFKLMPERFIPDAAKGMDVVIQFNLGGDGGGNYHAIIKDGACKIGEGTHASPTASITMKAGDYVAMNIGKLNGKMAFMTGKLKLAGDMGVAMKIQSLFRQGAN